MYCNCCSTCRNTHGVLIAGVDVVGSNSGSSDNSVVLEGGGGGGEEGLKG